MYSLYKNSKTLKQIERSYDLVTSNNYRGDITLSRKRKYDDVMVETLDDIFNTIINDIIANDVLPTLRTLILEDFYVLLSNNTNSIYFDDITTIVGEFRQIVTNCDKLYDAGDYGVIKSYIGDELIKLLIKSQHVILLFHLAI